MNISVVSARGSSKTGLSPNISIGVRRERRKEKYRRTADASRSLLSKLALWFANQEPRSLLLVDQKLNIILVNELAKREISAMKIIRLQAGSLEFSSELHRREFTFWLHSSNAEPYTFRHGSAVSSFVASRITLPSSLQKLALIVAKPRALSVRQRVQRQFGLTRAESEIATALYEGESLVQIAHSRHVSINTVKTQARHIFQKSRVHSQSGLTRRINQMILATTRL